jgi:hypothetical protein
MNDEFMDKFPQTGKRLSGVLEGFPGLCVYMSGTRIPSGFSSEIPYSCGMGVDYKLSSQGARGKARPSVGLSGSRRPALTVRCPKTGSTQDGGQTSLQLRAVTGSSHNITGANWATPSNHMIVTMGGPWHPSPGCGTWLPLAQ